MAIPPFFMPGLNGKGDPYLGMNKITQQFLTKNYFLI